MEYQDAFLDGLICFNLFVQYFFIKGILLLWRFVKVTLDDPY